MAVTRRLGYTLGCTACCLKRLGAIFFTDLETHQGDCCPPYALLDVLLFAMAIRLGFEERGVAVSPLHINPPSL